MRKLAPLWLALLALSPLWATEPCKVIRGRARVYGGDGQLRIWHVGTHHDYQPEESSSERDMDTFKYAMLERITITSPMSPHRTELSTGLRLGLRILTRKDT